MDTDTGGQRLNTIDTTIAILNTLRELNGGRVTEVANHMDTAKSTVHRHLQTLAHHGFVTQDGDEYRLGLMFLDVGEYTRHCVTGYREARPVVDQLAAETGERCQFVVEEHGRGVYVYVTSNHPEDDRTDLRVGKRMFLHSTASGKSILANLPESRVEEIIERWGLPSQTPHTVTTTDELFATLKEVRERGYAFNRGGNVDGLRAVGVPVVSENDRVIGSLSISGPTYRMQGETFEQDLPNRLLDAQNELQRLLTVEDG
jgi:DNA-binding IclR family transcriptional regulator